MTQFYIKSTQALVTESELRALYPNTSFPAVLNKETLDSLGVDVVFPVPAPVTTELQVAEMTGTEIDSKGNRVQKWTIKDRFSGPDKTSEENTYLAELLQQRKTSILTSLKTARLQKEKVGVEFEFPDGAGIIQTRDDIDIRNVQAVTTTAMILKSNGVADPVIPFRDAADKIHIITPDKAIELGLTVQNFISGTYAWMWATKAAVESATSKAELDAIQLG